MGGLSTCRVVLVFDQFDIGEGVERQLDLRFRDISYQVRRCQEDFDYQRPSASMVINVVADRTLAE